MIYDDSLVAVSVDIQEGTTRQIINQVINQLVNITASDINLDHKPLIILKNTRSGNNIQYTHAHTLNLHWFPISI